jgi:hypothetical protein
LATIDKAFIAANFNQHNLINSKDRRLERYEFIEILVRLATIKYKDTKQVKTFTKAFTKLMDEHILPYSEYSEGLSFR